MIDNIEPVCIFSDTLIESHMDIGKYYNGCDWAPDGSCLMTSSSDNFLRIYDTPMVDNELLEKKISYKWNSSVKIPHSEPIYDFQWYPLMKSTEPVTCFLATACRDQPVQLLDAYCGKKIHSFLCNDVNQCIVSPISLQFTPNGFSLVAGFKKHIRFFDLTSLKAAGQMSTVNDKHSLNNSLISSISFCKETFESDGLVALGSYDSRVVIYDYYSGDCAASFDLKYDIHQMYKTNNIPASFANGGCGGVTEILWSSNGTLITCGTRKCDWIVQYDIRVCDRPLAFFNRKINNNQKISFCYDHQSNDFMFSGGSDGNLNVWDVQNSQFINYPILQIPIHSGPFTGCDMHPYSRLLSTASGCRVFDYPGDVFIDKNNDQFFLPDARLCLWYLGESP